MIAAMDVLLPTLTNWGNLLTAATGAGPLVLFMAALLGAMAGRQVMVPLFLLVGVLVKVGVLG